MEKKGRKETVSPLPFDSPIYTCNKNKQNSLFSPVVIQGKALTETDRGTVGWFRFPRPGCSSQLRGGNFNGHGRRRERERGVTPLRLRCADAGDKIGDGAARRQAPLLLPFPLSYLRALLPYFRVLLAFPLFFAVPPALPARVAVCVVRFFLLGPSGGIP